MNKKADAGKLYCSRRGCTHTAVMRITLEHLGVDPYGRHIGVVDEPIHAAGACSTHVTDLLELVSRP